MQVYCINNTIFRHYYSNALTNSIAKESGIAKMIAMAMLVTKLLVMQTELASNGKACGKARYIDNYIANDKATDLVKAYVTAKTIANLIAHTQYNNHLIYTFSMTYQMP